MLLLKTNFQKIEFEFSETCRKRDLNEFKYTKDFSSN